MTKVTSTEQLREMIAQGVHDFFILLNGNARSSKFMDYSPKTGKYYILNEIDDTKQTLCEKNLFNRKHTNVGYAIQQGSFFSYEDYQSPTPSNTDDEDEFEFYGLTDDQEKIARDLYENNKRWYGNYTLEEVDDDTIDSWIDNAREDGDEEYEEFLTDAKENGGTVFSLTDHLCDFSQPIGEMVVY